MSLSNQPPPIPPGHRKKSWLRRNLVKWTAIILTISIPVWFVSTAVSAMMRRNDYENFCTSMHFFKSSVYNYLEKSESKKELPMTEGHGSFVRIWDGKETKEIGFGDNYTLDQILLNSDALVPHKPFPYGINPPSSIDRNREPKFSLEHRAFYAAGMTVNGRMTQAGQDWSLYNRGEVSLVDCDAKDRPPIQFPIVFKDGKIACVNFYLKGDKPLTEGRCAYYILKQVKMRDAIMLSQEFNSILDDTEHQNYQYRGRAIFEAPGPSGKTDVYFYLLSINDNGVVHEYWKSNNND
jgi:hypothetical protein